MTWVYSAVLIWKKTLLTSNVFCCSRGMGHFVLFMVQWVCTCSFIIGLFLLLVFLSVCVLLSALVCVSRSVGMMDVCERDGRYWGLWMTEWRCALSAFEEETRRTENGGERESSGTWKKERESEWMWSVYKREMWRMKRKSCRTSTYQFMFFFVWFETVHCCTREHWWTLVKTVETHL